MRRITVYLTIAVFTFAVGILTTFRLVQRNGEVERPKEPSCRFLSSNERISSTRFANDFYFPVGTFSPDQVRENGLVKAYSATLAAMDEPVLSRMAGNNIEIYRFLWFRSFHPAVVVRVWSAGTEQCMSVKQLDGLGQYVNGEHVLPKNLAVDTNRPLAEGEWKKFIELLARADVWSMPTVDGRPSAEDGAFWIMEGVRNQQYHVVDRQSPNNGGYYREACVYLLRISRLRIDEERGELY